MGTVFVATDACSIGHSRSAIQEVDLEVVARFRTFIASHMTQTIKKIIITISPRSASIVGAVLDKVVGPDVIAVLRPQPDARSVGQPEPASFGLFIGDLQPLASPDALDPLVVDYPARSSPATLR
jgi:hypothetical protein